MPNDPSLDSPIRAFNADQVCNLTGLSKRQLAYWDKTGFFIPEVESRRRGPYSRLYSFRDVVGLRTIAQLRGRVSLQSLRIIGQWLHDHYARPWDRLRFYTAGRDVFVEGPDDEGIVLARDGAQTTFDIQLRQVAGDMQRAVRRLRRRRGRDVGRVAQHRYVAHNRPVLAGTRVPAAAVWDFHQAGYGVERIIEEFPSLTPADVEAAIRFHEAQARTLAG